MSDKKTILLSHGSGGKLMHNLIKDFFLKNFNNNILSELKDSAVFNSDKTKFAFTTDSYVVHPIFFPGGDIGKLAVCGTINDLSMVGAKPLYISSSFIIEEGFFLEDLNKIIISMKKVSDEAGVKIITGDTKVVEKGSCDKIFINTSGIGIVYKKLKEKINAGDKIILSGFLGEHEITILSQREKLSFKSEVKSDCAPLNKLVEEMLSVSKNISFMRDPTRGGLATLLNEFVSQYNVGVMIEEKEIPLQEEVKAACEIFGFDYLHLANEGKLVAVVSKEDAEKVLRVMKKNKYGKNARIIGEVVNMPKLVILRTSIGGKRIVDMLSGEQLPRIC